MKRQNRADNVSPRAAIFLQISLNGATDREYGVLTIGGAELTLHYAL
ncbi:MAG: hypothetical protein LBG87_04050 [Spirochaetaceae bacterium]|nr:hypothetical protein [Spirochaetaceae bacterium]